MRIGIIVPLWTPPFGTTIHKWKIHATHPIQNSRLESFLWLDGILFQSLGAFGIVHPCLEIAFAKREGLFFGGGEGAAGFDAGVE